MNDRYTFCTLVSGRTATNWAISDWTSSKSSSIASILSSRFHFMEQNLTTLDLLLLTDKMVPSLHFWMRERSAPEAVLFSSLIFLMRLNASMIPTCSLSLSAKDASKCLNSFNCSFLICFISSLQSAILWLWLAKQFDLGTARHLRHHWLFKFKMHE